MNRKTRNIVFAALFAALICTTTLFLQIKIGTGGAYIHPGDSFIYIASAVLPQPFAALAALVGGSLADIMCGSAVWAPFTAVIKACNTLPFLSARRQQRIISVKTVLLSVLSGVITCVGYFLTECILYSAQSAAAGIVFNVIQASASSVIFIAIGFALDRFNFMQKVGMGHE